MRGRKREKETDRERQRKRKNSKTAYILKGWMGTTENFLPSSM